MKASAILKRRIKENMVVCDEYERLIKKWDFNQKELEERKRLTGIKVKAIKKENDEIQKTIDLLEGKNEETA